MPILMLTARREESRQGRRPRERRRRLPDQAVWRPRTGGPSPRAAAAAAPAPRRPRRPPMADDRSHSRARHRNRRAEAPRRVDGRDIELTDQEFRLLHLLATHVGIVFSREALLAQDLARRHVCDGPQRRHAGQTPAPPDRTRSGEPAVSADRLGRRLQVRGRLMLSRTRPLAVAASPVDVSHARL